MSLSYEFKMIRVRVNEDRDIQSVTLAKNAQIDDLTSRGWEPFSVVTSTGLVPGAREIWFKRLASDDG